MHLGTQYITGFFDCTLVEIVVHYIRGFTYCTMYNLLKRFPLVYTRGQHKIHPSRLHKMQVSSTGDHILQVHCTNQYLIKQRVLDEQMNLNLRFSCCQPTQSTLILAREVQVLPQVLVLFQIQVLPQVQVLPHVLVLFLEAGRIQHGYYWNPGGAYCGRKLGGLIYEHGNQLITLSWIITVPAVHSL